MHFELYKDQAGDWRWTLYASNGRKVADSAEGYHNHKDCLHGIELVRDAAKCDVLQDGRVIASYGSVFRPSGA